MTPKHTFKIITIFHNRCFKDYTQIQLKCVIKINKTNNHKSSLVAIQTIFKPLFIFYTKTQSNNIIYGRVWTPKPYKVYFILYDLKVLLIIHTIQWGLYMGMWNYIHLFIYIAENKWCNEWPELPHNCQSDATCVFIANYIFYMVL